MKKVVQDLTSGGIDWQREKWQSGLGSKFIHQGEKNAVKYADEVIVLSKGVQDYFKETYGRETHFIPNGVNRPQIREAGLITDKFGLKKDSYILFLGRLVPEKGIRYLVEAFKNVKTDKKLVIAGGSSDTDSFMEELKDLAKGDDRIFFTGFVQGAMLDELYSNAYIYTLPSDLEGMPLSLLEAMSYGNCCLVSDIPECAEVVEDKALLQYNLLTLLRDFIFLIFRTETDILDAIALVTPAGVLYLMNWYFVTPLVEVAFELIQSKIGDFRPIDKQYKVIVRKLNNWLVNMPCHWGAVDKATETQNANTCEALIALYKSGMYKNEVFRSTLSKINLEVNERGLCSKSLGKVPNFYLILEKDKTLSFYRECFQQVVGIRSSTMDWGLDANPEEGRLNEEQEIEQISTYLNFYRTNVCFLPKVIPEDIVYDEEYLKKICGAQLFPNLADARDSKEKLFRIANALSLPIGGIEQLLITQFIIKKGEDYQKISELLHMIAEQH